MNIFLRLLFIFSAVALVSVILPMIVASVIEAKWRLGTRKALLGESKSEFAAHLKTGTQPESQSSGLELWPYGESKPIGFVGAVSRGFVGWQDYRGRANRQEFWYWYLFVAVAVWVAILSAFPLGWLLSEVFDNNTVVASLLLLLPTVVAIATFLPTIAVGVRRLHDGSRSGLWMLMEFVPFGNIVLLVFWALPGTSGTNQYGPARETIASNPLDPVVS